MIFGPRQAHFIVMFVLTLVVVLLQAYAFARVQNPWMHVDIVSVLVVYMAIEHFLPGAFFRLVVAAVLMQQFSAAPTGFYGMYFILALVIANLVSRFLVLHSFVSQFLTFTGIFALKHVLLFAVFHKAGDATGVGRFVELTLPSFLITIVSSVPLFAGFARLDHLFEFASTRDRRHEIIDTF